MTHSLSRIVSEAGALPTKKERAEYLAKHKNPIVTMFFELAYTDRYEVLVPEDKIPEYRKSPPHQIGGYLYGNWRMMNLFLKGKGYDDLDEAKRLRSLRLFLEALDGGDAELIELILRRKRFPNIDITIVREAFPELNIVGGARK